MFENQRFGGIGVIRGSSNPKGTIPPSEGVTMGTGINATTISSPGACVTPSVTLQKSSNTLE